MNKYVLFMIMILFLVLMTFIADSLSITASVDLVDGVPTGADDSIGGIFKLMGTFFKLLTFNLPGIPAAFNFVFIPLTFGVIYMLIDIIKDLIPFT